jgi:hypothetical protein
MYHSGMSLRGGAVDGESHQSERELNLECDGRLVYRHVTGVIIAPQVAHAQAPTRVRHGRMSAVHLELKMLAMQPALVALASIVSPGSTNATTYRLKASRALLATDAHLASIVKLERRSAGMKEHMEILAISASASGYWCVDAVSAFNYQQCVPACTSFDAAMWQGQGTRIPGGVWFRREWRGGVVPFQG